jgi:transmembrane sensor
MIGTNEKHRLVFEQAARWFLWLRDHKADPDKMEVFQRWRSSGKNRRAYEEVENLWQACNGIDSLDLPWPTEFELEQDRYDGSYALPLPAGTVAGGELLTNHFILGKRTLWRRHRTLNWRVAASVCVVAVAMALTAPRIIELATESSPVLLTAVAQQRVEVLEDGSIVTLGGATQLSVHYNRETRRVTLEQGEAYFEVSKNSERPFIVKVGNSEVHAVGTAFNVNRRDDAVTVSVVEGVVEVNRKNTVSATDILAGQAGGDSSNERQARLVKGQELVFSRAGDIWQAVPESSLERAIAWREGRLAYVNERLDRVVQDVNRYSLQKIVIGDWELGDLRFTGTVFNKDIQSWLEGLQQAFMLRIVVVDERTVLVKDASRQS